MVFAGRKMRTVAKLATLLLVLVPIHSTLLEVPIATSGNVIETWVATSIVLELAEEAVLQPFWSSCPKRTA
jgi:hypothetical protein